MMKHKMGGPIGLKKKKNGGHYHEPAYCAQVWEYPPQSYLHFHSDYLMNTYISFQCFVKYYTLTEAP